MKNSSRSPLPFIAKITALIIFVLICFISVLYVRGVFDISFIDRDKGATKTEESGYDTLAPIETAAPPEYDNIEKMGAPETQSAASVTFDDKQTLLDAGSTVDTSDYSADKHTIALGNLNVAIPNVYSYRQMWEKINVKENAPEGGYVGAVDYILSDRKTVTLYAGYILYDCAGTMYLCQSDGTPLVSFDESELEPAYCYNPDGLPLFLHNGRYCHYDDSLKMIVEEDITYDHSKDSIGLYFEHSPAYGRSANGYTRYRNSKWKWSFINSSNDEAYKYYGLYNFSENLAAAVELKIREVISENVEVPITGEGGHQVLENGVPKTGLATVVTYERNYELNYLDPNCKTVLTGDKTYTDAAGRAVVSSWQTPLFTYGKEAMGYLYFENGLCRVREITVDLESEVRTVLSDTDYIIKNDGSRFPLPAGYEVVSYSDGMILLHKNGNYGFMNYEGEWVVQPVYTYAEPYFECLAVIGFADGKKAMVDTSGSTVIPFAYSHISNVSSGVIALYDNETGWQIAYKMTKPAEDTASTEAAQ